MSDTIRQLAISEKAPYELGCGIYALTTQGSYSYLVEGENYALVIDTGFGTADSHAAAIEATNKPLILVNTHGHGDHIGCDDKFDKVYASKGEVEKVSRKNSNIVEIEEGYIFDLGGRKLEVIALPGHTPGGIGLLDRENGFLFSGDMIGDRPLFLQFTYSNLEDYVSSMDKILSMKDIIKNVFCCHGTAVLTVDQASETKKLAQLIIDKNIEASEKVHLQTEDGEFDVNLYVNGNAKIYHE